MVNKGHERLYTDVEVHAVEDMHHSTSAFDTVTRKKGVEALSNTIATSFDLIRVLNTILASCSISLNLQRVGEVFHKAVLSDSNVASLCYGINVILRLFCYVTVKNKVIHDLRGIREKRCQNITFFLPAVPMISFNLSLDSLMISMISIADAKRTVMNGLLTATDILSRLKSDSFSTERSQISSSMLIPFLKISDLGFTHM